MRCIHNFWFGVTISFSEFYSSSSFNEVQEETGAVQSEDKGGERSRTDVGRDAQRSVPSVSWRTLRTNVRYLRFPGEPLEPTFGTFGFLENP